MKQKSLLKSLLLSLLLSVISIMLLYTTYNYFETKKKLISEIELNLNLSVEQLKGSLPHFINSYSINEYEKIIDNQLKYKNILGILVRDYNYGKIFGKEYIDVGSVKKENDVIEKYDENNLQHQKLLQNAYSSKSVILENESNKKIAEMTIFSSDKQLKNELSLIIEKSIIQVIVLSLGIVFIDLISIKIFFLRPLYEIINAIQDSDDEGIPKNAIPKTNSIELDNLSIKMNEMIIDIKNSKLKVKEINSRLQLIINSINDGIWDWNLKTNETYFSPQWKKILGFNENEINGNLKEWEKRVNPEQLPEVYKDINNYLDGKTQIYKNEHQVLCKDGTYKWILDRGVIVQRDENGKALRMIGTHTDIDETKRLFERLQILENRFANMFKNHKSIMLLVEPNSGNIIDANESAINFYGYSHEEFVRSNISILNLLTQEEIKKRREEAIANENNSFIFEHKLKNGQIKSVEVDSSPIQTNDGVILFSIIKDVTNEKLLQEEIIKEKDFISTIIDNSNAVIAVINSNGVMIKVNKYAEEFTGYSQKEISSVPYFWSKFLPESIKDRVYNIIEEAKKGNIVKYFKNSWYSRTGEERVFEWSNMLIQDANGAMDYIATIGIDITQRELNQKFILEQKQEFELIFNYTKDGIAITDLNMKFLTFNEAFIDMTEFTKEELESRSFIDFIASNKVEKNSQIINSLMKEGFINNYEDTFIFKDNKKITANISISLLPDKKRLLMVIKDVSSLKVLQEQAKLASLGEMIGNIAHQWRQPLSVITTCASALNVQAEFSTLEKDDIQKSSNTIVKQAEYLSNTIENFRNFIKEDKSNKDISIKDVIENTLSLAYASLHNNFINLISEINDDLLIYGNKNELIEAFLNIIANSKDALKSKDESDRFIFIKTKKISDDTIELKFLDSGGGINEEIISKILEPYFTTKHKSIGTGLGLSIADRVIRERHNGIIDIYNEDFDYNNKHYKGACFRIVFKRIS